MATVSDFGSLEIKQLRVQNDISAVRYGTEIMDKDLIFKVGDISNPNQSIRFSVHDGESYKDAFSVDSNGFAVSDLAMSGPSSGVIGIDELVKLGEMRVQHFNDHNNERAGEIVFSVNIGDTDVRTVDILSLSPEEVSISTDTVMQGTLSCNSLNTSTIACSGNEFRPVVASFSHPLGSNNVTIERGESGVVMLSGPLRSEESNVTVLNNKVLNSETVFSTCCSVSKFSIRHWDVSETEDGDLSLTGPGQVRVPDLSTSIVAAEDINCDRFECSVLSAKEMSLDECVTSVLSVSKLLVESIDCGECLDLPSSSRMMLGTTTMNFEDDGITVSGLDSLKSVVLSSESLMSGGLTCKSGVLSVLSVETERLIVGLGQVTSLSASEIIADGETRLTTLSCSQATASKINCIGLSVSGGLVTGDLLAVGMFSVINDSNYIKLDADNFVTNGVKSTNLSCAHAFTDNSFSSSISCSELRAHTCIGDKAQFNEAETDDLNVSGRACMQHLETFSLTMKGEKNNTVISSNEESLLTVSHGMITPVVSTSSLGLSGTLTFHNNQNDHIELRSTTDGLVTNSSLICHTVKSTDALHNRLTCTRVECDDLILTNHNFSTDKFSLRHSNTTDALVFDDSGLQISKSLTIDFGDDSNVVLQDGLLQTSREFVISCSKLSLPDTEVASLSTNSLVCDNVRALAGNIMVESGMNITGNISTSQMMRGKTLHAESGVLEQVLSTQYVYTERINVSKASGLHQLSGQGVDVLLDGGILECKVGDGASFVFDEFSFQMSRGSMHFSIENGVSETTITSSNDIVFNKDLSVSHLRSETLDVDSITGTTLRIAPSLVVSSHVSIAESCVIQGGLTTGAISCSSIASSSFHQVSTIHPTNGGVHFIQDEDIFLTLSRDSLILGKEEEENNARIDIKALPFRDGIRVTSDDKSIIKLQTDTRKALVLQNRRNSDEWTVGVGNYPLEKENTFGVYFNDEAFLQMDCINNKLLLQKDTLVERLSVASLDIGGTAPTITIRDCTFTVASGLDDHMILDCKSLAISNVLSVSDVLFSVMSPSSFSSELNINNNKIINLGDPVNSGDAINKIFLEQSLADLFRAERVFTAPIYWSPVDDTTLRSFALGLSYTNPLNESDAQLSLEILCGTESNHSLRVVSGLDGSNSLLEVFASGTIHITCPVTIDDSITLANTTLSSEVEALTITGNFRSDGVGIGIVPVFPLHVFSETDDDCAVLQSLSTMARTTVEALGDEADQAMITCKVGSNGFSSGYLASSDSYIVASSNDLSQNTHLVIDRTTSLVQTAGNLRLIKPEGNFSIEELGATTFFADKNSIKFNNFDISFENFSVDHKLGNLSLLNLSSFGARITGSTEISESLKVKNTTFSEDEIGDLTVDKKMIIPGVETNTISLQERIGFNIFQDDADVLRFREDGLASLLHFDQQAESINFSFASLPNSNGRGALFVADSPILTLKKQCVNIDTTVENAKLNVSDENGPQLSLMNPSNTPTSANFNVDDSGDLLVTATGRKYQFDGDISSDNLATNNFLYFGNVKEWRLGVTDTGSFVIQHHSLGGYVTKTEVSLD
jgi:hypothetical protein